MKTVIKIASFFTAIILTIVTFTSVVGYQSAQSIENNIYSPLFNIKIQRAINKTSEGTITLNYLGKGKTLHFFPSSQTLFSKQLDKALKIINTNPKIIQKLCEKISKNPQMMRLFHQHGLNIHVIKQSLIRIKNNPELLKNEFNIFSIPMNIADNPQPLGLDTSSALGCFIVALILLPLALMIGVLIATITLITCLNIGDCFTNVVQAILNGMLQGLDQP